MIIIERYMTEDLKLGGSELLVYADIVSNLNAANEFIKLQPALAADCGLSIKTVYRSLKILEDRKLIKVNKARDGRRYLNIINISEKQTNMLKDEEFNRALSYYDKYTCVHEEKCNRNYLAFKAATKIPTWNEEDFKTAVICYKNTIEDPDYYKTHLYTFDRFLIKYREYIPGGHEFEQYKVFCNNKHKGKFFNGDRQIDTFESGLIPDEELDNIEV